VSDPLNLARYCLQARADDPSSAARPAFTFVHVGREQTWSYATTWERVQRIGRGLLARGLEPGDRVLLRLPHSPDYAFAFFGATVAGLVPIPASPQLTTEEAAFLVDDAQAHAVVSTPEMRLPGFGGLELFASELETIDGGGPLPETDAEDSAFLIYTSGTGSRPKGVLHAHRSIRGRALMREGWQGFRADDVTLHAGTLNWSYTLGVGLMDPWAAGAHAMLVDAAPDAAAWPALLQRLRVTILAAVPTVYRQILKYGRPEDEDLSALRYGLCAAEPLLPELLAEWRRRVGTELYEALGMTEVSTYISSGPATPVRPGSPGRPQPGRRVAILAQDGGAEPLPAGETGLLAVHRTDPGLMLGYWRRPEEDEAVTRGEWFVGGDLASIDKDGYVWFHGRADDVIKSFGYRLSPVEIETALASCPGVTEVAVVALPVDEAKTLVTACVVPQREGAVTEAALKSHAAQHLADYKRPHQYRFVDALPRTPNGKLRRRLLAERMRAEASGD
jgi:acyl-coenzyme A synthetase/AMP-(fatty) acid ligase